MGAGRVALTLALVTATAACGSRGAAPGTGSPDAVLPRNALPGLIGRRCHYASDWAGMPALARIARLGTRGNVAIWGLGAAPSDSVVVSVRYGEEGRLEWVRAIASSLPPGRVASLERLLLTSMQERGPADWGVRLSVVGGDLSGMAPSVVCPVERRRGTRPTVAMPTSERGYRALERARGRRFTVEVTIDELGRVLDVRLPRSSGEGVVDQFLLDWVHGTQFRPKLHDGIPLAATIEQVIYIPRHR